MSVSDISHLISDIGFPIAVSCYLLYRMEKTVGELRDVIEKLCSMLDKKN
jgi:hypothetical protein